MIKSPHWLLRLSDIGWLCGLLVAHGADERALTVLGTPLHWAVGLLAKHG